MAITKEQAIAHNKEIISDMIATLAENKMVDPVKFITDRQYAVQCINNCLEATNLARTSMGMPKLFLYNVNLSEM